MKKTSALLFALLLIVAAPVVAQAKTLVPGGQVIGLQLEDNTVCVAGFHEELGDAARSAGLKEGDRILSVNGKQIASAEGVRDALKCSDGQVQLGILRSGKTKKLTLAPIATADGPKLGVYLKQGTSGLGTVTYYDPDTGAFGALGHGVNDPGGKLLNMEKGSVYDARILTVKKGKAGAPGQLMGQLTQAECIGVLQKNTLQGVFGKLDSPIKDEPLPVADETEIHPGSAVIRSTVNGQALREYSVEIIKIYPDGPDRTRNMLLKITDERLLEQTGGIVQGMSGSPIIQDGKLVGAVTHVLVSDPTTGYGIFIENMLDAAA